MAGTELRPRLASEIVDAAFQLYRRHFTDLVTLTAIAFAPLVIAQLLLTGGTPPETGDDFTPLLILSLGAGVLGSLAEAAIVVAVSNSYLAGHADVAGALRHTIRRLGTVLLAIAAKWFLIFLGFTVAIMGAAVVATLAAFGGAGQVIGAILMILGFVVGFPLSVYFFARYFAVPATIVLEAKGVRSGLRRSAELSRGHKWKVIGALGIPIALFGIFQAVLAGVMTLAPGPDFVGFLIAQAIHIVIYPVLSVIATLLYYDARIRHEGFDIEVMAADLAVTESATPPGPA